MHPADAAHRSFAGGRQLIVEPQMATTAPINPVALRILQAKGPDGAILSFAANHHLSRREHGA